jgi:hypothetical protein
MRSEVTNYGNMKSAAIAVCKKRCNLATRNAKDFEHTEVEILTRGRVIKLGGGCI